MPRYRLTHAWSIRPAREAALRAEGLDKVANDAARELRRAWPYRHTSYSAPIVVRANVTTLRDVRALKAAA